MGLLGGVNRPGGGTGNPGGGNDGGEPDMVTLLSSRSTDAEELLSGQPTRTSFMNGMNIWLLSSVSLYIKFNKFNNHG